MAETGGMSEELLADARRGDEAAFERLVELHRGELYSHCYRMLGSIQDAEDAVQEALLGAWRGLAGFDGRSSLRGRFRLGAIIVLSVRSGRISWIASFLDPQVHRSFPVSEEFLPTDR